MANSIRFGEDNIDKIYLGDTPVDKIYLGNELIYSTQSPVEKQFTFTFQESGIFIGTEESTLPYSVNSNGVNIATIKKDPDDSNYLIVDWNVDGVNYPTYVSVGQASTHENLEGKDWTITWVDADNITINSTTHVTPTWTIRELFEGAVQDVFTKNVGDKWQDTLETVVINQLPPLGQTITGVHYDNVDFTLTLGNSISYPVGGITYTLNYKSENTLELNAYMT